MLQSRPRLYWCRACNVRGVETPDGNCPAPGCGRDKLVEMTPEQTNVVRLKPRLYVVH